MEFLVKISSYQIRYEIVVTFWKVMTNFNEFDVCGIKIWLHRFLCKVNSPSEPHIVQCDSKHLQFIYNYGHTYFKFGMRLSWDCHEKGHLQQVHDNLIPKSD